MVINLRTPEGKEILNSLIGRADVLLKGFQPGAIEKLGFDYTQVAKINPRIIYCSIASFGQAGPYRSWPLHDLSVTAVSGLLSLLPQPENEFDPVGIAGLTTGANGALAITAALLKLTQSGQGCYIDVSMFDSMLTLMSVQIAQLIKLKYGWKRPNSVHCQIYAASDDKLLAVGVATPSEWKKLCYGLNRPDLVEHIFDEQKMSVVEQDLALAFRSKTRDEWAEVMLEQSLGCTPVQTLAEVPLDPQSQARKMFELINHPTFGELYLTNMPFKLSGNNDVELLPPPDMGQHSQEILLGLGYSLMRLPRSSPAE